MFRFKFWLPLVYAQVYAVVALIWWPALLQLRASTYKSDECVQQAYVSGKTACVGDGAFAPGLICLLSCCCPCACIAHLTKWCNGASIGV